MLSKFRVNFMEARFKFLRSADPNTYNLTVNQLAIECTEFDSGLDARRGQVLRSVFSWKEQKQISTQTVDSALYVAARGAAVEVQISTCR